jgi:hypothetical protein
MPSTTTLDDADADSDDSLPDGDDRIRVDRGLPKPLDAPLLAFAATIVGLVLAGAATGDPVTWGDAPGVVGNAGTAATAVGGARWLVTRWTDA